MPQFVACPELSALREHYKRVWSRHMHPDSARRREASFAMRVAVRLFDLHRFMVPAMPNASQLKSEEVGEMPLCSEGSKCKDAPHGSD